MVAPELARLEKGREEMKYVAQESVIAYLNQSGRLRPGIDPPAAGLLSGKKPLAIRRGSPMQRRRYA